MWILDFGSGPKFMLDSHKLGKNESYRILRWRVLWRKKNAEKYTKKIMREDNAKKIEAGREGGMGRQNCLTIQTVWGVLY